MSGLFDRREHAGIRLVLVALLSCALMYADHNSDRVERLRAYATMAAYPIQLAAAWPARVLALTRDHFGDREQLVADNQRLRSELFEARASASNVQSLRAENGRLRKLMDSAAKVEERVLIAELLAVDLAPFSRRVVLNKGTLDGVSPGFALIDAGGIMGQVVSATPFSSNALLITDPNHALPVQAYRTGLRAVAVGTGKLNTIRLDHVPNNADIEEGDLVVTSGLGGRFPPGYPVGRIIEVHRYSGRQFAQVTLAPSADLERNREVLVLRPGAARPAVQRAVGAVQSGSGESSPALSPAVSPALSPAPSPALSPAQRPARPEQGPREERAAVITPAPDSAG